jgi:uncharacterized protein YgbK (DUF1537 family)
MIVVIADDITGAAELAGIGLRYGLDVLLSTAEETFPVTDLLVISTDSRSMREEAAVEVVKNITKNVSELQPSWIYKKIDSVLRGHVIAEVKNQLEILGLDKALVIGGNPALNRVIVNGKYYYNDRPIHLSSFSHDPEFPVTNHDVLKMLRTVDKEVRIQSPKDNFPDHGIVVGEVTGQGDLQAWAAKLREDILPVGASGFFAAILEAKNISGENKAIEITDDERTTLFVCGTTFNKNRNAILDIKKNGGPVSYMPLSLLQKEDAGDEDYQVWSSEIIAFVQSAGKVIIAIDPVASEGLSIDARSLRTKTARVVKKVFEQEPIHEIFIEGGSTADSIISELGYQTFIPVEELAPGVVRMQVQDQDLYLTVKPGSYDWPQKVWDF